MPVLHAAAEIAGWVQATVRRRSGLLSGRGGPKDAGVGAVGGDAERYGAPASGTASSIQRGFGVAVDPGVDPTAFEVDSHPWSRSRLAFPPARGSDALGGGDDVEMIWRFLRHRGHIGGRVAVVQSGPPPWWVFSGDHGVMSCVDIPYWSVRMGICDVCLGLVSASSQREFPNAGRNQPANSRVHLGR
jgi:hypothetical protein